MLSPMESQPLTGHLFTVRIILSALFAGIVVGLVSVMLFVQPPANPVNIFLFDPLWMGLFCFGVLLVWAFLPRAMDRMVRRQILQVEPTATEPREALIHKRVIRLLNGHLTRTVIMAAMLEAPGMIGIVGYTLGATKFGPTVAAISAGLIAILCPSRSALEDWLQEQLRLLDEETVPTAGS